MRRWWSTNNRMSGIGETKAYQYSEQKIEVKSAHS